MTDEASVQLELKNDALSVLTGKWLVINTMLLLLHIIYFYKLCFLIERFCD